MDFIQERKGTADEGKGRPPDDGEGSPAGRNRVINSHFNEGLNIREIILSVRPFVVVEAGVREGDNTLKLVNLKKEHPFILICFDVNQMPVRLENRGVVWQRGVSYLLFPGLADGSVGIALIDTDHNYWTLIRELETIAPKMQRGGVICVHDTWDFKDGNGTMPGYADGTPYPMDDIQDADRSGLKYGMAIPEFLKSHPEWRILRETDINNGATALVLT